MSYRQSGIPEPELATTRRADGYEQLEQAQHALRESERRFAELVDGAVYGVLVHRDFTPLYANEALARLLGYDSVEEIMALPSLLLVIAEHERRRMRAYKSARLRGEDVPTRYEYDALRKDGKVVTLQNVASLVTWGGEPAVHSTVLDATEVKVAQVALRESEERFRSLIEGSVQGVLIHNDFRALYANQAFVQILGYDDVDELMSLPSIDQTIAEHDRERLSRYTRKRLRGEAAPIRYEFDALRKDGRVITLQNVVSMTSWGGEVAIQSAVIDITESRRAQTALRESEERFRAIADATPYPLFIARRSDGRLLYANDMVQQVMGFEDDFGRHSSVEMYWDPRERESTLELLRRHGRCIARELRHRRADDSMFWAVSSSVAMEFEGHDAILTSFIDISERKQSELELDRYRRRLEELVQERTSALETAQQELLRRERLATIGQLTGTVSHELRNPLGTIHTSYLTIRQKVAGTDPLVDRSLAHLERNIGRCTSIIDELLSYARTRELKRQETLIDEWIESLVGEQEFPDVVRLETSFDAGVTLAIDRERLRQAIANVIHNACQAMTEQPGRTPGGVLAIATAVADHRAHIRIADTGPGIASDQIDLVFEPLYSTRSFGVGLGLPLVRQVMSEHGGDVELQSAPGAGTTVTLSLPL